MAFDIKLYNVVMLGICFMLIFTAFQTSGNVQTSVLNSYEPSPGEHPFKNKGYISLAIIYTVFALANFIAPPICNLFGPRIAMFIGGICYSAFIGSIIQPYISTLYIASVIVGVGAALIWTGQGNYLTLNSTDETMGRNSGIFWALLQCSLLYGNMFVYFYFKGDITVSDHQRRVLYIVLLVGCGIGTLAFFLLRKSPAPDYNLVPHDDTEDAHGDGLESPVRDISNSDKIIKQTPLESFLAAFKLLRTKDMLLLCVCIAYTGFELTFFSGVYGTCVGNIDPSKLSEPKRQIGLVGMMIGAGEITGGLLFGIFGKKTNKYGRDPIVLFGFILHCITYFLIFLNMPDHAPLGATAGESKLGYSLPVFLLCAYMLGLGDASFNTQLYSIFGTLYSEDSAPAFALFKCIQSVAAAIGFAYGSVLVLKYQLLILVVTGFLGTLAFFKVERKHARLRDLGYDPIR